MAIIGRMKLRGSIDDFFIHKKAHNLASNISRKEKVIYVSDWARRKTKEWGMDLDMCDVLAVVVG